MAPQREHVLTTAFSSQIKSSDERSILVEAGGFRPTRWFLERGAHEEANDAEPPRKRQKTQTQSTPFRDVLTEVASEDDIPIFEVTVDFHFPDTLKGETPSRETLDEDLQFGDARPIFAVPYGIETDYSGTRLHLGSPQVKGAVLVLECDTLASSVVELLRSIALPGQLLASAADTRKKTHPASILNCTLTKSAGQRYTVVRLRATLHWRSGASAFLHGTPIGPAKIYHDYEILATHFPDRARDQVDHSRPWTPQDFYESVQSGAIECDVGNEFKDVLESELYPFQKRAVSWMLGREGVQFHGAKIEALPTQDMWKNRFSFYEPLMDLNNRTCFINHLQGIITRKCPPDAVAQVSGGLLAEEMGLGKTVELMATITLHRRQMQAPGKITDDYSGTSVLPSKATLIITPPAILDQWKLELGRHAPALSVYHYTGISNAADGKKQDQLEEALLKDLASKYDVVLTTYPTLGRELHFAEDPPKRNMRHQRRFERRRSPLVQIHWWRICLDEAQMVESGVTAAARVACRLPRVHSWAVSGTPLRKNVEDLRGLLIFLRYRPFTEESNLWSHLVTNHRHIFRKIFGQIALRHTKAQVRNELRLPPQKRVVISMPFSVVEEQNYSSLFAVMCEEVGLTANGAPVNDNWDPEDPTTIERMRSWLSRLRQTCLHPQVGSKNRKALGRGRGPLRTVAEVLDVMIEQNETNLRLEERALISASVSRAHVLGNNGENERRSEAALPIYEDAMQSAEKVVLDARQRLAFAQPDHFKRGDNTADTEDEDSSAESTPLLGRLKNDLRTAMQLQHVTTFFAATSYFQIKSNENLTKPDSDQFKQLETKESTLYESAKVLRREILRETSRKAEALMRRVAQMKDERKFTAMPKIKDLSDLGGIESQRIVNKSYEVFDAIRAQGKVMTEWRAKMADYLQQPLVDEDEGKEMTGDEYEDSTKQQDELYVYFDALKAVQADLNTFVTGEPAPLIDHEVKVLMNDAKKSLDAEIPEDQKAPVHAPELTLKLCAIRNDLRRRKDGASSIRGLIQEARALEGTMEVGDKTTRVQTERHMARMILGELQGTFTAYTKAIAGLEKDWALFRSLQNQRVEFYRQLQELSDAVAPFREELDEHLDEQALGVAVRKEEKHKTALAGHRTKNRFLLNLRDESGAQTGPRICVICQSQFESGVLTVCGHQYCRECIQHWFSQARTCPICKRKLDNVDMHDITYRPQEIHAQEELTNGPSSPVKTSDLTSRANQSSIYSDVDMKIMNEIKAIDLPRSYGTKIDTLGRHLHWIREHDPGAKSIVFSQYREFLDVLGSALAEFKLGYARLGRAGAVEKFRWEASVDCLLLDAKTDSSGLTLVNATHVFMCEPLIQTAVELQAIARVHRIGQTRPTTVWMYLISDTVEEAIYETSVARRLAHVQARSSLTHHHATTTTTQKRSGKSRSGTATPAAAQQALLQENAIDVANSEELQAAPLTKLLAAGKGGGEVVGQEDLWQCLFGRAHHGDSLRNRQEMQVAVRRHLTGEAAEQRRQEESARA